MTAKAAHARTLASLAKRKPGGVRDFGYATSGVHTEGLAVKWRKSKKQGSKGKKKK